MADDTTDSGFDALLEESRTFPPSEEFRAQGYLPEHELRDCHRLRQQKDLRSALPLRRQHVKAQCNDEQGVEVDEYKTEIEDAGRQRLRVLDLAGVGLPEHGPPLHLQIGRQNIALADGDRGSRAWGLGCVLVAALTRQCHQFRTRRMRRGISGPIRAARVRA